MLRAHGLTLYEPGDLRGEMVPPDIADLRQIATWAVEFLNAPNQQLGRRGPVCPYTRLSMDNNCFLLAWAGGDRDVQSVESTVDQYRRWFLELLEQPGRAHRHLLTILVVLPGFDRTDSGPLDALQGRFKDAFVREGLMVGQARKTAVGSDDLPSLVPDGEPPRVEDPVKRFWRWVEDDAPPREGLELLLHHLGTFWDRRQVANVVMVHYADLQAGLEGEMRRLAGLLGIVISDDVWPGLVAEARFDRMRDRADELAPQVTMDGLWHDTSRFFNRGTSGQWRTFLGPEDLDRYEARVSRLATPGLAAWAHGGWRGYRRLKRANDHAEEKP